jgi:hypothetical protein
VLKSCYLVALASIALASERYGVNRVSWYQPF